MAEMADSVAGSVAAPGAVQLMLDLYRACLAAADPARVVPPWLPPEPKGRTVVVGVGKASAAMARAVERAWRGPLTGVVAVPRGARLNLERIEQVEGSHPLPGEGSVLAGQRLLQAVQGLGPDDLVLALVSGGGSALCCAPVPGLSLAEKQAITQALLLRGATIHEINTVRKHLSLIKGGRLAAHAHPAQVVTLVISDIPGDDPGLVASAPTLGDASTCADALNLLDRYGVALTSAVRQGLQDGAFESPSPQDPRLAGHRYRVVASAATGLAAAAALARQRGWPVHVLSDAMEGEARDLALAHAAIARHAQRSGEPFSAPCVLLSGGEATVTVRGNGRGGRNTEFALALAQALQGQPGLWALSAGTDGLDGSGAAAGAWIGPQTLQQGRRLGLCASDHLHRNDSHGYFDALGATVVTGPTHTNINDFRAIVIEPR